MTEVLTCDECGDPLDDGRPVQWNLAATVGVHFDCVPEPTDEGDDE